MCARVVQQEKTLHPGDRVIFNTEQKSGRAVWQGFARIEGIDKWLNVWKVVEIPADSFAERGPAGLTFSLVKKDRSILALAHKDRLVIVTREATEEEAIMFLHNRVPLTRRSEFQCL